MQKLSVEEITNMQNKFKENSVLMFEGYYQNKGDKSIIFDNDDSTYAVNSYLAFLKHINKNYTFFQIINISENDLKDSLINIDSISQIEYGRVYYKIVKEAEKYNKKMLELPINTPVGYRFFIFHENIFYSFGHYAEWYEIFNQNPYDALEDILSMFEDELEVVEEEKQSELEKEKLKLKKSLDLEKDKYKKEVEENLCNIIEFRMCGNRKARYAFVERYLREKDILEKVCPTRRELEELAELAWTSSKNKKINFDI